EAEPLFREAAEGYERTTGVTRRTAQCWANVGHARREQKRYPEALAAYQKALDMLAQIPPEEGRDLRPPIADYLAVMYTDWGKPEEAAKWKALGTPVAPPPRERKQ